MDKMKTSGMDREKYWKQIKLGRVKLDFKKKVNIYLDLLLDWSNLSNNLV